MPTQVIMIVPARTCVTFSCAPPSCMLGKVSTISLPPVACSTSFLNCSMAIDDECLSLKLPAMRIFSCAEAGATHASTRPAAIVALRTHVVFITAAPV